MCVCVCVCVWVCVCVYSLTLTHKQDPTQAPFSFVIKGEGNNQICKSKHEKTLKGLISFPRVFSEIIRNSPTAAWTRLPTMSQFSALIMKPQRLPSTEHITVTKSLCVSIYLVLNVRVIFLVNNKRSNM